MTLILKWLKSIKNHNPKYYFLCLRIIGDLVNKELRKELYDLDILDGSPLVLLFNGWIKRKAFKKEKNLEKSCC